MLATGLMSSRPLCAWPHMALTEQQNAVQKRTGMCTPPEFELFAAKPYALALQTMMFDCGTGFSPAIMEAYEVTPQSTCLAAADGKLAVDFIVRCALMRLCSVAFSPHRHASLPLWQIWQLMHH